MIFTKKPKHAISDSSAIETDADLMHKVAVGDPDAVKNILATHLDRIYQLAYRICQNQSDAEEIAQESFVKLWRQSANWHPSARISTWLYRVAYHQAIDVYRKSKKMPVAELEDNIIDQGPAPHQDLDLQQRQHHLQAAINSLPERQKMAIMLVHQQEMSQKQASAALEISVEALESLLSRARRKLRQTLAPHKQDLIG